MLVFRPQHSRVEQILSKLLSLLLTYFIRFLPPLSLITQEEPHHSSHTKHRKSEHTPCSFTHLPTAQTDSYDPVFMTGTPLGSLGMRSQWTCTQGGHLLKGRERGRNKCPHQENLSYFNYPKWTACLRARMIFFLMVISHYACFYSDHYMWPKIILAWLAPSCHSNLVLNVPSSEKLSPNALMYRGPGHSPSHHPDSLFLWHLAVPGLFLLCSSLLCLEMIAWLLQCHTLPQQGLVHPGLLQKWMNRKNARAVVSTLWEPLNVTPGHWEPCLIHSPA